MSLTWGNSWLESWGNSWDRTYTPPAPTTRSGGAVIVDLPKKRGRKPKKAAEPITDRTESPSVPVETSRVITEEEAAGMAAMYGIPEKQAEIEVSQPQAAEIPAEVESSATLEPFQIPESVFGVEPVQPEQVMDSEEVPEEDDIALILAIIEAIG